MAGKQALPPKLTEIIERSAAQAATYQRRIDTQKVIIDRLLKARMSEVSDKDLIRELCEERRVLVEQNMGLQARIDAVDRLVNVLEEGAQQINTDLVREALNG